MIPTLRGHADAVKAALAGTGRPVGDGTGKGLALPYSVLYEVAGGSLGGPVARPYDDADQMYQVTSVGSTAEQARWMADKVRAALLGSVWAVAGRSTMRVGLDVTSGLLRDDDVQPPLYYCADRYRVTTTPA